MRRARLLLIALAACAHPRPAPAPAIESSAPTTAPAAEAPPAQSVWNADELAFLRAEVQEFRDAGLTGFAHAVDALVSEAAAGQLSLETIMTRFATLEAGLPSSLDRKTEEQLDDVRATLRRARPPGN